MLYLTTAPGYFHQWIVRRLDRFVGVPLEQLGLAFAATAPVGVIMPGCDPVQPDCVLVRGDNAGIINDRRIRGVIKRRVYARAGVPEYWIIRPETRDVLVCRDPHAAPGDYTFTHRFDAAAILQAEHFPVTVPVAELFASAPDTTVSSPQSPGII